MDDLISRQTAIDAVLDRMNVAKYGRNAKDEEIIWTLERLPSAQTERMGGKWEEIAVIADTCDISGVKTWASKMKCDQCGFTTVAIEGHFSQYNFCPNCGADMRGEQE